MLPPRSISAFPPSLDRESIRAALVTGGPWPSTAEELVAAVCEQIGRDNGRWVAKPEEALLEELLIRTGGGGPAGPKIAAPALGRSGYQAILRRFRQIHWMEPGEGSLDPGPAEIAQAVDWGAQAVLLAPITGNCAGLTNAAQLCGDAGALLVVDARAAMGTRILESGPESYGDLCLVPVDCEPAPSPCPGAILFGASGQSKPTGRGPNGYRWALQVLRRCLGDEPRLRRLGFAPVGKPSRPAQPLFHAPPPWSVAVAFVRLGHAHDRASQRAHHARALLQNCGNLPAVHLIPDEVGLQSAGGSFPMLARERDAVAEALLTFGVETVPEAFEWLAPPELRGPRAQKLAEELLLLPLHPFYRAKDIDTIAEALRRATARANSVVGPDLSET
ncbi:MAG: hypothetical protein VX498_07410 [Myxococcota bacterium]|nr:hypothetical protein [Myxococcota bacterium]